MIRVLVVDETPVLCRVTAAALESDPSVHVVGCANSVDEALPLLLRYNVVLASATLPNAGTLSLVQCVGSQAPWIKVLLLGTAESSHIMLDGLQAGAAGYVLREAPLEHLLESVRMATAADRLVLPEAFVDRQHASLQYVGISLEPIDDTQPSIDLTSQERRVLHLIRRGLRHQEIADYLDIERSMARQSVQSILRKLNTRLMWRSYIPPATPAASAQRADAGH